jgi:4-hydroxybenzoate polyprenyltransferase/geranylgeranylglycerol-phosphate geranylgeranyltransferase
VDIKTKVFAHIETWRPYTVLWCGLVSLAGSCLTFGGLPDLHIAILATITPILGWVAALYASDFFDRKLDAIQKPHRPIPSGRIKPYEAFIAAVLLAIIAFIFAFILNIYNVLLGFLVAVSVISYAKFSKSRGILGNLNRGFIIWLAFLFGALSVHKEIPINILLVSLIFPIHDTNSNLVGAIRDIEGDKKGGYITIPVKYGIKKSVYVSLILTLTWFSLALFIPLFFSFLSPLYYIVFSAGFGFIIVMYIHLLKNLNTLTRKQALFAHELFVVERVLLASAFIFGVTNPSIASIILIIAITITISSQHYLRERYEFTEVSK